MDWKCGIFSKFFFLSLVFGYICLKKIFVNYLKVYVYERKVFIRCLVYIMYL